ncbi:MAG: hypothetical protein H0W01_08935 [Pseudonocardiales bacterium]|nr:hypothetical protein [Pseudonocardiales bacterium]
MTVPPYPTNPAEQPRAAGPAPKEVETAFRLLMANVVIGIIGSILSFATIPSLVDERIRTSDLPNVEAAVRTGIIIGVVIGLVILALYIFFAFQMRGGKNWARITLTVLGALSVVFTLIGIGTYSSLIATGLFGVLSVVISLIQLGLVIAAIYFMFRPAANAYFTTPLYR